MSGHYRTLVAENVGKNAILFSAADSKRELCHFRAVTKGSELGAWELFNSPTSLPLYLFLFLFLALLSWFILLVLLLIYCAFQKHTNSKSSKAAFSIAFFAAVNHNYKYKQQTLKHRNTQNGSKSTNHKPWIFELVKVNFCFLRGPLRWLTVMKNANVSWVLNFRIPVFLKSIVIKFSQPINQENTKTMVREHFSEW